MNCEGADFISKLYLILFNEKKMLHMRNLFYDFDKKIIAYVINFFVT